MRQLGCLLVVLAACAGNPPTPCTACGTDDTCVDLNTDVKHCGACDTACDPGSVCSSGTCALSCSAGLAVCSGACIDTQNNPKHCGGCSTTCDTGEFCVAGSCASSCPSGQVSCSGSCAALATDALNCGACNHACGVGQACVASTCTTQCQSGQQLCGADAGTPTCATVATDRSNCGGCGITCSAGQVCSNGSCDTSCGSGLSTCTADGGAPYCATLPSDNANCGACGRACNAQESCSGGNCTNICGANRVLCGGADGGSTYCADTRVDPTNCGACGNTCGAGTTCLQSACQGFCGPGRTYCTQSAQSYCTDTHTDDSNCGSCGNACGAGQSCADAGCANFCGAGKVFCTSTCVDPQTDPLNCGSCGKTCPLGEVCVEGGCATVGFPQSCDELQQSRGASLANGEYPLYFHRQSQLPYQGYCFTSDAGAALTYLTLPLAGGVDNYSDFENQNTGGGGTPRCITAWQKYRFEPNSGQVVTDDFTFSVTDGGNVQFQVFRVTAGMSFDCTCGARIGGASIDLRGTPFSIDPSNTWIPLGSGQSGSATPSNNNQTMKIIGGGCCGDNQIRTNALGTHNMLLKYTPPSCATIKAANPGATDGVYTLAPLAADAGIRAYCDMTSSGGGWTLVAKIDGANPSSNFFYDSVYWTGGLSLNSSSLDLSKNEARLDAFATVPAHELRIVSSDDAGVQRALSVTMAGTPYDSIRTAFGGGSFVPLAADAGVPAWTNLYQPGGTLQQYCNLEGLNITSDPNAVKLRIGVVANAGNDCTYTSSYAGVGAHVGVQMTQNPTRVPPVYCYPPFTSFTGYAAGALGGGVSNMYECVNPGTARAASFTYLYVR